MRNADAIHVGTSGWHYEHWKGPFYPADCAAEGFFSYYAKHFQVVEVNNSFYQLPAADTLNRWKEESPEGFVFAMKASRYITHMKKLKDPVESIRKFMAQIQFLGEKLGPILFQLPPKWKKNPDRLDEFLQALPKEHRYAFEFRDPSWFEASVYYVLTKNNAAFCIYDLAREESPRQVTADLVYVRLHGPGGAYRGRYDVETLSGWAGAFSTWAGQGKQVYCFFDNDEKGYAAEDALKLKAMIEG